MTPSPVPEQEAKKDYKYWWFLDDGKDFDTHPWYADFYRDIILVAKTPQEKMELLDKLISQSRRMAIEECVEVVKSNKYETDNSDSLFRQGYNLACEDIVFHLKSLYDKSK